MNRKDRTTYTPSGTRKVNASHGRALRDNV